MLKKRFLTLFCGLIFSLGFAPFDLWWLSILSISTLLYIGENLSKKESFITGYIFGFGMWLSGISWLYVSIHYHGNIGIFGSSFLILLFIAALSIYSGLVFLLNNYLISWSTKSFDFLTLPTSWVIIEIIRSYLFTGFPWLISGTMLADSYIDGLTPIIGAQGNSFFLILLGVLIFKLIRLTQTKKGALLYLFCTVFLVISAYISKSIEWTDIEGVVPVSLHQPNLTLKDKWSNFGIIKTQGMIYDSISRAEQGEIIVFPETALILSEKDNLNFLNEIRFLSTQKNITLITGIVERQDSKTMRNRLQTVGATESYYDKVKLVPFGEFIPLEAYLGSFLDILGLDLTNTLPGEEIKVIKAGKTRLSPSICYEIAFDNLIRTATKDSNLLVTVSNDTWFGKSIGPIQHLEIAQNRALEHNKELVRSTNSGITAFISKKGTIIEKQEYFEEKKLKRNVTLYSGNTFFSKYGNFPLISIILIYLVLIFLKNNKKRTNVT